MLKSHKIYKRIFVVLYVLSIVLVISAVIDFFFFGHNYVRSQVYMAAAFVSTFVSAITYGIQRRRKSGLRQVDVKASAWVYVGVIAFAAFFVLFSFTGLLISPVVLHSSVATIMLVVGKVIFDKYQIRSRSGFKLTLMHKIGIGFAVGAFVFLVYLSIADLFSCNPIELYL